MEFLFRNGFQAASGWVKCSTTAGPHVLLVFFVHHFYRCSVSEMRWGAVWCLLLTRSLSATFPWEWSCFQNWSSCLSDDHQESRNCFHLVWYKDSWGWSTSWSRFLSWSPVSLLGLLRVILVLVIGPSLGPALGIGISLGHSVSKSVYHLRNSTISTCLVYQDSKGWS